MHGAIGADSFVRAGWPDRTTGGNALEVQFVTRVAQVLTELPGIVQAGLERIAQVVVGAVVGLPIRVAQVLVVRNLACGAIQLGALQWQELAGDAGVIAGVLADESQLGVVVDVPGQAGRDVVAFVRDVVYRRTAVTHGAAHSVQELACIVELASAVEVDLLVVVAANLGFDFVAAFQLRPTTGHVQQAAWWSLAVDRRGRATQHGDALQVPGLDLGGGVVALGQWQAIEELGRHKTPYQQPVTARVGSIAAALHASGVAKGVVQAEHRPVFHLLAGDHAYRAGKLGDGGVGLGARCCPGRGVTVYRPPGAFIAGSRIDRSLRQRQCPFRRSHQAVAAHAALLQLQAGAAQGGLQGTKAIELPAHRGRGAAADQCRVDGQGDAGLAGDLVESGGQRGAGQVVGALSGLLGGEQGRAGQWCGHGDGQGHQAGAQDTINSTGHAEAPRRISAFCFLAERDLKSDRANMKKN